MEEDKLTTKNKGYLRREYTHGAGPVDRAQDETHLKAKALEATVLHEEMKEGGAHSIGQHGRHRPGNTKARTEEKRKERDTTHLLLQALRQNIETARQTLDDLTKLIDLKLEQALTGQALKQQELHEITASLKAIDNGMERLERGEALELDETGRLKDKTLEAVIQRWEEKTGKTVDRENPAFLMLALKTSKPEYEHHKKLLEEYLDVYKEEIDLCKYSDRRVKQLLKDGKDIENKSPAQQQKWIEEADTLNKSIGSKLEKLDAKKENLDQKIACIGKEKPADTGTRPDNTGESITKTPAPIKLDF